MAKGNVSLTLPADMLDKFKKEAELKEKPLSEVIFNALVQAEEAVSQPVERTDNSGSDMSEMELQIYEMLWHLAERIKHMECQMLGSNMAVGEFAMRAVRASAGARYYARLSTSFAQDISSLITRGVPLDTASKNMQLVGMETNCIAFEKRVLSVPYMDLVEGKMIADI